LRRVRLRHLHLPALSRPWHRDRHPDGAGGRRRARGLQSQGRPRARRGHPVPGLQRAQAPQGRRSARPLFQAHRMRRRRARYAVSGADAGRAALARHHPHPSLRLHERHEVRRARAPRHRHRRTRAAARRHDSARRARGDRGQARRRLFRRGAPARRLRRHGRAGPQRVTPRAESNSSPSHLAKLNDAAAVRERCGMVHRWVADGRSPHFTLDESRLAVVAAYVADVTREAYPDLTIPYHSRWRHFSAGGIDRWGALAARSDADGLERTRMAGDLATLGVLLDAGAGDRWRYREAASALSFARSEGLAVASFDMFRAGAFSSDPARPWRVDGVALANIDAATLARHFQVDSKNPLVGLEERSALLRRLRQALADRADLFAREGARPGNLVDYFLSVARDRRIA